MDRAELEATLATAAERVRLTELRLQELADRLVEMDEERESLLGQAALTKQAIADYKQYQERVQQELMDATRREEAEAAFQRSVDARDAALEEASASVANLAEAFDRVNAARDAVARSHVELKALNPRARAAPPEPTGFRERWTAIAPLVEQELQIRLESELVEAAARSGNYHVIKDLPDHLQELANQRLREHLADRRKT